MLVVFATNIISKFFIVWYMYYIKTKVWFYDLMKRADFKVLPLRVLGPPGSTYEDCFWTAPKGMTPNWNGLETGIEWLKTITKMYCVFNQNSQTSLSDSNHSIRIQNVFTHSSNCRLTCFIRFILFFYVFCNSNRKKRYF